MHTDLNVESKAQQLGTLAVRTKALHGIKRVPQCSNTGSTESTVKLLYININDHVGEPKQTQTRYTVFLDQEFRTMLQ